MAGPGRIAKNGRNDLVPGVSMSTGVRPLGAFAPTVPATPVIGPPLAGRLTATEMKRRLLHMSPGVLPFVLLPFPHQDPWGPLLVNIVVGLFFTLVLTALFQMPRVARPGERDGRVAVLGYALPILGALSLFRGHEEIGLLTLVVLAFGDGSATLGGLLFGGKPLPWNPRKSWTGTLCFVACATPLATLAYWGEARPVVPLTTACTIAGLTTVTCALIESLPSRWNDNLRVGTSAAILCAVLTRFMVG
jgi:phytol kinase